jgi:hypothetical protein
MIATFTVPPFFGVLAMALWPALAILGTAAASTVPARTEPVRLMKRRRVTWAMIHEAYVVSPNSWQERPSAATLG